MESRRVVWVAGGLAVVYVCRFLLRLRGVLQRGSALIAKGANKRKQVKVSSSVATATLPEISAETARRILTATLGELIAMRDKREVTCSEIVLASIRQTVLWDEKLDFVLDERFAAAYAEALECDRLLARGETKGVLTGIPFSAKDVYCVESLVTAFGCASHSSNVIQIDSRVISQLKDAGAIVLFKSSMGMLGATAENSNRIVGVTKNPWDASRVPGGSSGGDAAAVSSRCVSFAMGSDVGGSVRIPAAFCGIYAFKPSANRLSGLGEVPRAGYPFLFTAFGPLARSVSDLAVLFRLLCERPCDPFLPPLSWSQAAYDSPQSFRIAVASSNAFWPVTAANQRVVAAAADSLRRNGHSIVDFDLGNMREFCELACALMFTPAEGGLKLREEPPLMQHRHVAAVKLTPLGLRWVGEWACGNSFYAMVWKTLGTTEIASYIRTANRVLQLREEFNRKLEEDGIDALIVPFAMPAFQHDMTPLNHYACTYTVMFNLLDLPAGSVPIDLVSGIQVGTEEQSFSATGDCYIDSTQRVMQRSAGLPLAVQVVTRRYKEEVCLNLMRQLQAEFPLCPPEVAKSLGLSQSSTETRS